MKLIETPDILPNNMRQIRIMRGITTNNIAEALSLNHSYISVVENCKSNISSTTAFKLMRYLNANFEQFFDMKQTMILPFTLEYSEDIKVSLRLEKNYIEMNNAKNIIYIEETMNSELITKGIDGKIESFEIIKKDAVSEEIFDVLFNVKLIKQEQIEREFDINLLSDMNYELFIKLNDIGYFRKKKVPINNVKDDIINIKGHGKIKSVEYEVSYETMNNIKYIEESLKLTPQDIQTALGIKEKTYSNIVAGTQKIPLKIMWRMVKLFKVPLELIINIPLYMEKFTN